MLLELLPTELRLINGGIGVCFCKVNEPIRFVRWGLCDSKERCQDHCNSIPSHSFGDFEDFATMCTENLNGILNEKGSHTLQIHSADGTFRYY